jgi:thiamine biosynthesis lipoprotein
MVLRFARRAMATTFEVILPFNAPRAHELAATALDEIDRLEAQLTVYRDHSEISRLNATAADHPMPVEAKLFALLSQAERIHRDTEGAFDIAVGALIKTWGFYRRAGRMPTPAELAEVRERIGMQHIVLDAERQTVAYRRRGLELNLGSIGKGYALDQAARLVNTPNLLMHGGHSSVLARGNETPDQVGWTVGISDPVRPGCRRGLWRLRDRALATSAATHQHFRHQGKTLGHLLDPRTAWPAQGILSATVSAPTAAEADALATGFFILGIDKARAYCERHPHIGAALIVEDAPHRLVVLGYATDEIS